MPDCLPAARPERQGAIADTGWYLSNCFLRGDYRHRHDHQGERTGARQDTRLHAKEPDENGKAEYSVDDAWHASKVREIEVYQPCEPVLWRKLLNPDGRAYRDWDCQQDGRPDEPYGAQD